MAKEYDLNKERLKFILISSIFGTIGVVTHFIPLSFTAIVFYRALLGGIFIIIMTYALGKAVNIKAMSLPTNPLKLGQIIRKDDFSVLMSIKNKPSNAVFF